jgi:YD repeat-containing protein
MIKLTAYLSVSIFILFQMGQIRAQENYWEQNHHVPIPANAAALFKPMEKPVGTSTGIPPINIPIYNCSYRGYNLPITLNYHAGGIRVEELAGSTGLAWSLSAGGMITRIQNGVPDEVYLNQQYKPSQYQSYTATYLYDYLNGNQDYEPDYFLFSINGVSGKFVFNEAEHAFVTDKNLNMKVSYVMGVSGFEFDITDSKGYVFQFRSNSYNPLRTWYLECIKDMNGIVLMSFKYTSWNYDITTRSFSSIPTAISGDPCTTADNWAYENIYNEGTVDYHLWKIIVGSDTVVFNLTGREDIVEARKISSIEVKDRNNILHKKYKFNYDYFYNGGTKRLMLKDFSEQSVNGSDSLTYTFTYDAGYQLPGRLSYDTDYWGYYNGAANTSPIPNGIYTYYDGYSTQTKGIGDKGDRRANVEYGKANTLTRITYPSGGYREFEYEGNDFLYSTEDYNGHLYPDADDCFNNSFDTTEFDLYNDVQYGRDFTVNATNGYSLFYFNLEGVGAYDEHTVRIKQYGSVKAEISGEYSGYFTLPNGTYTLEFSFNTFAYFTAIYCYWDDLNLTSNTIDRHGKTFRKANQNAGGVRIKKITDYDPLTGKSYYTRFKYFWPDDTALTSGMLISYPKMIYKGTCLEKGCRTTRIASHSAYPLNSDQGSYVFYPYVRVIEDGNGYMDNIFQFQFDYDQSGHEFPILPNQDNSYHRGQLLSTKYYTQSGTLIQEDFTEYINGIDDNYEPGVYSLSVKLSIWDVDNWQYCSDQFVNPLVSPPLPAVERSVVYGANGQSNETKTFYNYYTAIGATALYKKSVVESNGDSTITWYRYPFNNTADFKLPLTGGEQAMKDTLKSLNLIEPIETATYRKKGNDSVFIEATKVSYGTFAYGKRLPATIKRYSSMADSIVINISAYDVYGNVQENYKSNDIKEVILWGYNGKYIVAKVFGSDLSTVQAMVNNSVLQNPSNEAALRTELNNIRNGLAGSKAQATTYTYVPTIGVSSVTDPNGNTLYYEYDQHGWLTRIRDKNNHIVKKFINNVTQ